MAQWEEVPGSSGVLALQERTLRQLTCLDYSLFVKLAGR